MSVCLRGEVVDSHGVLLKLIQEPIDVEMIGFCNKQEWTLNLIQVLAGETLLNDPGKYFQSVPSSRLMMRCSCGPVGLSDALQMRPMRPMRQMHHGYPWMGYTNRVYIVHGRELLQGSGSISTDLSAKREHGPPVYDSKLLSIYIYMIYMIYIYINIFQCCQATPNFLLATARCMHHRYPCTARTYHPCHGSHLHFSLEYMEVHHGRIWL